MRKLHLIMLIILAAFQSEAQQANCTLKPSTFTIHFGSGDASDMNAMVPARYTRVTRYCPSDGYFTFSPYTEDCFRGDWFTLTEDHTAGDNSGNMLLVNSSPRSGMFFGTSVSGLKGNTTYEFGVWMMNLCRITEKCPFPLLPDITIHIQTAEGKNVAQLSTGELFRVRSPEWKQFQFLFTTPPATTSLKLIMVNSAPGGCGNDFAMDDITFRECIIPPPVVRKKTTPVAKKPLVAANKQPLKKENVAVTRKSGPQAATKTPVNPVVKSPAKPVTKAATKPASRSATPVKKTPAKPIARPTTKPDTTTLSLNPAKLAAPTVKQRSITLPPPPEILRTRTNSLVKRIVIPAGEIKIDLYDNGEIDNDTVTIYHNNRLLKLRARLSAKPVTFRVAVNPDHPHHEFTMVANNLGSIPPNTSLMIVTAGDVRHEVFISSTKQTNAKVVIDLGR